MKEIIYLDSAASALKPQCVVEQEVDFLQHKYANSARGICARANNVDKMLGEARTRVAYFIGADANQIVFTSGATDGLNRVVGLIKNTGLVNQNSVVAVSDLDHRSARMPWVMLAKNNGCALVNMPLDDNYNIDINKIPKADIYVISGMSNVLGVAQNVMAIVQNIRAINPSAITIVDVAQYIVHLPIDAKKWDIDFMCFSGHKIGADTGVGIMYIKKPDMWMPDKFGGGMIEQVKCIAGSSLPEVVFRPAPEKFEAGTLPLTQIAGIVPAIDYLESHRPDTALIKYMYDELSQIKRIKIITPRDATLLTFVVEGMHALDFGIMAGAQGICLRVGSMCASWIHDALGLDGTIRISVGSMTTKHEVELAIKIIKDIVK